MELAPEPQVKRARTDEDLAQLGVSLMSMPRDVVVKILKNLSLYEIARLRKVSREFRERYIEGPGQSIWEQLLIEEAPEKTRAFLEQAFPGPENALLRLMAFRASTRHRLINDNEYHWKWHVIHPRISRYSLKEKDSGAIRGGRTFSVYAKPKDTAYEGDSQEDIPEVSELNQLIRNALQEFGNIIGIQNCFNILFIMCPGRHAKKVRLILLGTLIRVLLETKLKSSLDVGACAIATCTEPARYTCGRCREAVYCSAACQARDWHENAHSRQCRHE